MGNTTQATGESIASRIIQEGSIVKDSNGEIFKIISVVRRLNAYMGVRCVYGVADKFGPIVQLQEGSISHA